MPLGTPAFHYLAPGPTSSFGPLPILPLTLEAISFQVSGGTLGLVSPVTRFTVQ